MARNIIILSDGTGQRGGVLVDEQRSNIYKLFRATRCGPESDINPAEQVAFYDPGIGTLPPNMGFTAWRRIYNVVSQALGLGLTKNIIDCYAAIIKLWRPGDRIFLFGFSRGAYTARCLGGVIAFCGVPTTGPNGVPLSRSEDNCNAIATEAVKTVYQHTSSWNKETATLRQLELLTQRAERARRFRARYHSGTDSGPGVYPHFIGVFDTVASLSNPLAVVISAAVGAAAIAIVGTLLWFLFAQQQGLLGLFKITAGLIGFAALGVIGVSLAMRAKSEVGLPRQNKWRLFHFAEARMNFYDIELNPNVGYARHALSIDETRESFTRVRWGDPKFWRNTQADRKANPDTAAPNPEWFQQLWFAGNHSDIGGSYPEDESRLSDITMRWMLDAATAAGMKHDAAQLRLYPDPAGPQHDETKTNFIFGKADQKPRRMRNEYPLHDSVLARFETDEVLLCDLMGPYRPANLASHPAVAKYYSTTITL